jgi:hypothetical protein
MTLRPATFNWYNYCRHDAGQLPSAFYDDDAAAPAATEALCEQRRKGGGGRGSRDAVLSMAYDLPLDCSCAGCRRLSTPPLGILAPKIAAAAAAASSACPPQPLSIPLLLLPARRKPGRPKGSKKRKLSVTPPRDNPEKIPVVVFDPATNARTERMKGVYLLS